MEFEHMKKSIKALRNGIGKMDSDAALATTLVLAFSESWDVHISTGIEAPQRSKSASQSSPRQEQLRARCRTITSSRLQIFRLTLGFTWTSLLD